MTSFKAFRLTTALAGTIGTVAFVVGLLATRFWVDGSFYVMAVSAFCFGIGYWRLWIARRA